MITAEDFFRNKIKEKNPNIGVVTLSRELITAEEGMRWAHEFKQLHLHAVSGRSELLLAFGKFIDADCDLLGNGYIEEMVKKFEASNSH